MKYRFNYLSFLVALFFSGCDEVTERVASEEEAVPFTFSVQINNTTSSDSPKTTKGTISKTAFSNGERIALFLAKDIDVEAQTLYFKKSVYQLALDGGNQIWSVINGAPALSLYSQKANLFALYPSEVTFTIPTLTDPTATPTLTLTHLIDKDMGDLASYTLSTGGVPVGNEIVKLSSQEIDYLAGKGSAALTPSSPSTTIEMNHMMAMGAIRLTKDSSYLGTGILTGFAIRNISGGSIPLKSGTIDLTNMSFMAGNEEVEYQRSFINHHLKDNVGWLVYPAICPVKSIIISLTIDGEVYEITNDSEITFQKGQLTVLDLTIKSNQLFINHSLLINDWPVIEQEHEIELE